MNDLKLTTDQLLAELGSTFGYSSFRPLQQETIEAILAGRDVFVLMPTGGGKSLCYQLPALLDDGLTVVVSPLIALMKDQVDSLRSRGVAATFINSSLDSAEVGRRQAAIARREIKLVYVAPERLMMPSFLQLLKAFPPTFIAVDEAHCISEWGHDFRPEYRELRQLRSLFPSAALGAFTATATSRVQADIVAQLGLQKAAILRSSFNRPNLVYDVWRKRGGDEQLQRLVQERAGSSGIVYCLARAETERVAAMLSMAGHRAAPYHAGLSSAERQRTQDAFLSNEVPIIVATIAFGMGIDKPNVRFVVHYDLPKSLEGYYQESGRAGRDGDPSDCILLFSYADVAKYEYFVTQKESLAEQNLARTQLRLMADWAEGAACRRKSLLAYFDETFDGQPGPCCDVCRDQGAQVDFTIPAQMLLSCILRTGQRFGLTYVVDVLRAGSDPRIAQLHHDQLSTYGIGRDRSKEDWQYLGRQLRQGGYLDEEPEHRVLSVTDRGRTFLAGSERVLLPAPPAPRSRTPSAARSTLPSPSPRTKGLSRTARASVELFHEGLDPETIAAQRYLSISTVEGHLEEGIAIGEIADIDGLVAPEKQRVIQAAIAQAGSRTLLKPIKELLDDSISYAEIRFVCATLHRDDEPNGPTGVPRVDGPALRNARSEIPAEVPVGVPVTIDERLFERLRDLRRRLADERQAPAFIIFPDRVLRDMVIALPSRRSALLAISGVGERKADDFGKVFLAEIANYLQEPSYNL